MKRVANFTMPMSNKGNLLRATSKRLCMLHCREDIDRVGVMRNRPQSFALRNQHAAVVYELLVFRAVVERSSTCHWSELLQAVEAVLNGLAKQSYAVKTDFVSRCRKPSLLPTTWSSAMGEHPSHPKGRCGGAGGWHIYVCIHIYMYIYMYIYIYIYVYVNVERERETERERQRDTAILTYV